MAVEQPQRLDRRLALDVHVWLMPQNPAYEPILGDEAKIIGKVVSVLRRL